MNAIIIISTPLIPLILISLAFVITYLAIPKVVKYAYKKKLLDVPDERKAHQRPIPALGGISIMAGVLPSFVFLLLNQPSIQTIGFVAGAIVLFITGVIDDLKNVSAIKRLLIQLTTATLIVGSGIKFNDLFGIAGFYEIPDTLLFALNIIVVAGIINAFNLIDGINGLAGGLGCISVFSLGILLLVKGEINYAIIAFSAAISYLAFLRYNLKPTFIFMGDNGSLVLGYFIAVLSLVLLKDESVHASSGINFKVIFAVCSIPVFDSLRVFAGRMLKGRSPFSADRTHIHHLLLKKGYNHSKSSLILYSLHLALIAIVLVNNSIRLEFIMIQCLIAYIIFVIWMEGITVLWSRMMSKLKIEKAKNIELELKINDHE